MEEDSNLAKAKEIGDMFTRIANRYDLVNTLITFGRDGTWRRIAARLSPPSANGWSLDVAAGTAELTVELARTGSKVVGVDFCSEMMLRGKAKVARKGLLGKAEFVFADALTLPFADNSFDCATMGFAMRNMTSIARSLAEMRRVVRPGGRVICLELTKPISALVGLLYRPYLYKVVPFIAQRISGEEDAYTYFPNSLNDFPTADELVKIMEGVGLRQVEYKRLNLGTVALHVGLK